MHPADGHPDHYADIPASEECLQNGKKDFGYPLRVLPETDHSLNVFEVCSHSSQQVSQLPPEQWSVRTLNGIMHLQDPPYGSHPYKLKAYAEPYVNHFPFPRGQMSQSDFFEAAGKSPLSVFVYSEDVFRCSVFLSARHHEGAVENWYPANRCVSFAKILRPVLQALPQSENSVPLQVYSEVPSTFVFFS